MKQLRSKKYPQRAVQYISDEGYEELKRKGLASKFYAMDIVPIKAIIPSMTLEKVKKTKLKDNDKRGTESIK
jgi:hypothetical protein